MKCMACGVEKDLTVLEVFPGRMCEEPIPPLLAIECEGDGSLGLKNEEKIFRFKVVVVCHQCFEKLEPDMWIGERRWRSLEPVTPYEELPLVKQGVVVNAENYGLLRTIKDQNETEELRGLGGSGVDQG